MYSLFSRTARRLFILAIGFIALFILVRQVFPWLNQYIPAVIAVFIVYLVAAYFALPAVLRIAQIIWRPTHIPTFSYTLDGQQADPVNIAIIATEAELQEIMQKAGWIIADPLTLKNSIKTLLATIFNRSYPSAPFSSLFLFGRMQDYGFQIPITKSPRQRHHVRFWASTKTDHPTFRDHVAFWQERHGFKRHRRKQRILWVGAAIKDSGIGIIRRNGQVTHRVDPDTNAERDFLITTIIEAGIDCQVTTIKANEPFILRGHALGGSMIADGNMKVCEVKTPPVKK